MRSVIQSFKKVIEYAPTSRAAGQVDYVATSGQDSVAAGQTSVTDVNVPTGSILKYIEVHFSITNLINQSAFVWMSIQRKDSGQLFVDPRVVGGNPQRNQVHWQTMKGNGQNQNNNYTKIFKVPKKFQRVKEGSQWSFTVNSDVVATQTCEIIYKFYR